MKIEIDDAAIDNMLCNFIDKIGMVLIKEAMIQVPVKTGDLRRSLSIIDKNYENKKVVVGSELPYAIFVEMGHMTKKGTIVPPQPYLRPALDMLVNNLRA
jgi:hypothetical protein